MTITNGEREDPIWWCNHHKQSTKYLVVRIHQLLEGSGDFKESIEGILRATLPNFAESVGVDLDEIKIS